MNRQPHFPAAITPAWARVALGATGGVMVGLLLAIVGASGVLSLIGGVVFAGGLTAVITSPRHRARPSAIHPTTRQRTISLIDEDGYSLLYRGVGTPSQ